MRLILETIVLVFLTSVLFYGCSSSKPVQKPIENIIPVPATVAEKTQLIKGEIDFLKQIDAFFANENEVAITLIGFKSGEGAVVLGIHPGLKEGKKVKIYMEKSAKIYKGALIYEVKKIDSGE